MKELIQPAIETATNLDEVRQKLLPVLMGAKQSGGGRLGYVSGIITSDGEEYIWDNIAALIRTTQQVRNRVSFPVYSATDVFTAEAFSRLRETGLPPYERERLFNAFWVWVFDRQVNTDLYLTPGWHRSTGCKLEFNTAFRQCLDIHEVRVTPLRKRVSIHPFNVLEFKYDEAE